MELPWAPHRMHWASCDRMVEERQERDKKPSLLANRNSENQKNVTETRPLKLRFTNRISQLVHTGVPIKGGDGQPLFISLVDCQSGELVTSIHEASARVEIVVLKADFGEDSCSREVFKSKTVLREGNNRALLTGNVVVDLKAGVACLSTVRFSQSKIWRKMCDYRLGAIALDDDMGVNIKEGVTDSFIVKDGRLKENKKDYSLTLDSEVWRLAKISKDGPFHRSLSFAKIHTARDFLKELNSNPQKLRDVLGRRMHSGPWEELKAHAKTLEVDCSDNWAQSFRSKIVCKEGNKPLTENATVYLNKGIGCLGTVGFPRARIYKRKCADMLGIIVTDDDMGTTMKEGSTNSFVVKDGNQNYMKHYLSTLTNEVWQLDNIAKTVAFHCLLSYNINTVEDFLKELNTDPQKLRVILGKGMSCRKWPALVTHALKSKVDGSHNLIFHQVPSCSEIKISPKMNGDFAQPAIFFTSKDSSVEDQRQCNGLPSMIVLFAPQDLPFKKVCCGLVAVKF